MVADGREAPFPQLLERASIGQALRLEQFGVDADDKYFLVVAAVKDAEAAALGEKPGGAPEEVVVEFVGGRLLERT